ncbi:MAG: oligosaccharide flippase family protein [Candidatus Levybacteria bacterium]|nr:oligosaccharide flippase family protein [Candidatus Levybacteria bacterium]
MKKIIKSAMNHPLVTGSTIIFFGSMTANILNYLFNLGMGRFLLESEYGTFISLISVFNIFSVLSTTVNTVFTKFSAVLVGQKKEEFIGQLFISGSWWIGIIAFCITGFIIIFSYHISRFLNINSTILIDITALALFFSYLSFVGNGILQGLLKFGYYSFINIFSSLSKLILGLGFIFLGFKVFGAISAFFLSALIGYLLVFFPLRKFLKNSGKKDFHFSNLRKKLSLYALPVFLANIGMTAFITIDIILVKHFFEPTTAGQYAAISTMGRSIFYAVSPIALVLFPLVAQRKERGENLTGITLLSLFLIGVPSLFLSLFYFTFPEFVRTIFYPSFSQIINQYLGPFSLFVLFYTLSYVLNIFYLSIGKIRVYIITILAACAETALIWFLHDSVSQVINILILSSFLLFLSLLFYYPIATKKTRPNSI